MSPKTSVTRVVVLGAGITGLTAAWRLQRAGFSAVVLEKSSRMGGAIGAVRSGGWLHELGPNSLLEGSREVAAFIEELGLGPRRLYASPAAKQRYIVRRGRLVAMPTSPWGFATTKLFSARAKLALLGEPFRARGSAEAEESVASFVLRRLGREFLDYAVNPFVGGVYAGDPARLSLRHAFPKLQALEREHGSLIRGALKRRNASGGPKGRIFSFPNGLGEIPAAIAAVLGDRVKLNTTAICLRRIEHGWEIECESDDRSWTEPCDAIVCALPADALATLKFEGVATSRELSVLKEIEHPPVASVFTGFRSADVRHSLDGFGVLVPQLERRLILGTLFSSTLFSGRAPQDHVALTTFVGGMRRPDLVGLEDRELLRVVQEDLGCLLGVSAPPVFTRIQRWTRAIPQYTLGFQRYKDAISAVEAEAPGLFIGGNCRDGISLSNCIAAGGRLANAVVRHMGQHAPAFA